MGEYRENLSIFLLLLQAARESQIGENAGGRVQVPWYPLSFSLSRGDFSLTSAMEIEEIGKEKKEQKRQKEPTVIINPPSGG
jgi:hypothetical protein